MDPLCLLTFPDDEHLTSLKLFEEILFQSLKGLHYILGERPGMSVSQSKSMTKLDIVPSPKWLFTDIKAASHIAGNQKQANYPTAS